MLAADCSALTFFCADLFPCRHINARDITQNSRWQWSKVVNNNNKPIIGFLFSTQQFTENKEIAKNKVASRRQI
jgi:hypothetical protein